jgi:alkanesulfonate monooxygenase SsuD/methylene tetrahydromethanopterin reductase-like flavin-dependent oxidoreductase (luciferase family)
MRIGFKTSPQGVDWAALDATWACAGELDVFEAGWLNDHLTDLREDRGGPSLEAVTLLAALAHHVPGKWLGHAVLSNTFRHPAVLAKAATVLDHVSGGRFVVGLGAGWHEGEHESLGIPLPAPRERVDRFESAIHVLRALFSAEAAAQPGVTRPDRFYPLEGATNEPPPLTRAGPPIYLGGQGPRGLRLAGRLADGWLLPGANAGDAAYFRAKRDLLVRELEDAGRDPGAFAIVAQVHADPDRDPAVAIETAMAVIDTGATELILATPRHVGPESLRWLATEVAEPVRERTG